jgi:hypothetical protein
MEALQMVMRRYSCLTFLLLVLKSENRCRDSFRSRAFPGVLEVLNIQCPMYRQGSADIFIHGVLQPPGIAVLSDIV